MGLNPAGGESPVDDRVFDVLDGYRGVGDSQNACAFTRGRTGASGKLGKIIGLVEAFQGILPTAPVDEVVPFGNQVVDRATVTRLAEGDTSIHTARTLALQMIDICRGEDLSEILHPNQRFAIRYRFSRKLLKAGRFTHLGILCLLV